MHLENVTAEEREKAESQLPPPCLSSEKLRLVTLDLHIALNRAEKDRDEWKLLADLQREQKNAIHEDLRLAKERAERAEKELVEAKLLLENPRTLSYFDWSTKRDAWTSRNAPKEVEGE
jgi:hypothetical protein